MKNDQPKPYCGVDCAKAELVVSLPGRKKTRTFANDKTGLRLLERALRSLPVIPVVVCEASGGYERPMLEYLHGKGIAVCQVYAWRVHHFARGEGHNAKTDSIDAHILAEFGRQKNPEPWEPLPKRHQRLKELFLRRGQIAESIRLEKTRLETAGPSARADTLSLVKHLSKRRDKLERQIRRDLAKDCELQKLFLRLTQVGGIGETTAWAFVLLLPEIGKMDDNRLAALVGVAPFNRDSGNFKGKRAVRGGRADVRQPLYMAAVAASKHNPVMKALYDRLIQAGKPTNVALIAFMRRLLLVANKIARDPDFVPVT